MKISHRLYVTIAPAIVGAFAVAGLAYWGRYARQAPEIVVVVAILAAVLSFAAAWSNARHLAQRIERLAGSVQVEERLAGAAGATRNSAVPDEIDEIQGAVERLSRAVDVAESDRADLERRGDERVRDHARLLVAVVDDATRRVDEVRLPLHILLDSHFGELNENQEEMLGAARAAAEAIDTELVTLRRIAELDLGERALRLERLRTSDMLEAVLPLLMASAQSAGASLRAAIAPLLPAVVVDRVQMQEALATLFRSAIGAARSGDMLELRAQRAGATDSSVEIGLLGAPALEPTIHTALAMRVIAAHGGRVEIADGDCRVLLVARAR